MATIRPNGPGWQAIIRRKGHKTISKTFPKKALAERWARQQEEALASLGVQTTAEKMSVAYLLDQYRAKITPRKKSARKEVSRIGILVDALGGVGLNGLSAQHIIDYVDDRLESVSADTVRKEINTLSVAIDAGMALWGLVLPANPVTTAKGVLRITKTLTPGVRRDRRPTGDELSLIYDQAPGVMGLVFEFAVETAMRRGEIANIKPHHRKGDVLQIPETKTDKPRTIPLTHRAAVILDRVGNQFGVAADSITQAFARTCAVCGIVDLRVHDLRHEAASRMIERGLTIPEVAAITGQTFATLQRYTHLTPEHLGARLRQGI